MGDTKISWTDKTWNPVRGCSRTIASGAGQSGCGDGTGGGCYAERMAGRFSGPGMPYEGLVRLTTKGSRWTGDVRLIPEHLADPLRWKKPRRIFVNSMSDLFHEKLTNEQIAAVFGVMAACPQHTFQILTKRATRMRAWFEWVAEHGYSPIGTEAISWLDNPTHQEAVHGAFVDVPHPPWPLPSVWLGVSVENQAAAVERIPELLRTPAAVRFLSCEPLIGPVDLAAASPNTRSFAEDLDWVIAGCESGPGARSCLVDWLRALRDQCAAAHVPFFLKQAPDWRVPLPQRQGILTAGTGSTCKAGGVIELPYLDGVQHAAFPESP